ncbi:hypothetical protein HPB52_019216 [Rhipicephalus sanguineus]|uniref:Uncharacterized protein n=1 Tax=Rhipicephalus sanguineus TaxID=34632 RepID=A0A9D4PC62_RHISA|nr:hypothetical protein HPB52_019216 [Rhipicephalus sanguineus]
MDALGAEEVKLAVRSTQLHATFQLSSINAFLNEQVPDYLSFLDYLADSVVEMMLMHLALTVSQQAIETMRHRSALVIAGVMLSAVVNGLGKLDAVFCIDAAVICVHHLIGYAVFRTSDNSERPVQSAARVCSLTAQYLFLLVKTGFDITIVGVILDFLE